MIIWKVKFQFNFFGTSFWSFFLFTDHEIDGKANESAHENAENEQRQPSNDKENQENGNENSNAKSEQLNGNKQNEEAQENETQSFNKLEHKPRIIVKHNILGNRVPNQ